MVVYLQHARASTLAPLESAKMGPHKANHHLLDGMSYLDTYVSLGTEVFQLQFTRPSVRTVVLVGGFARPAGKDLEGQDPVLSDLSMKTTKTSHY